MSEIMKKLGETGIIPVIKIDDANTALPLTEAMINGGICCAEVTFRTDAAEESIALIAKNLPNVLLGAGTVLSAEQVDKAVSAGASFIVSPGINRKVVEYCLSKNIPIIPGCITPTEIEIALEYGLETVKFFPAEQAGGLGMIKALSAPYNKLNFIPTGGINLNNLAQYLSFNKIIACGGSFMVNNDLDKVTELSKQAVKIVKEAKSL